MPLRKFIHTAFVVLKGEERSIYCARSFLNSHISGSNQFHLKEWIVHQVFASRGKPVLNRFQTGLSSEEEGVDFHGLDGDGEALFNLQTVIDERQRHLASML
jgi:hypothetical protein